MYWEEHIDRLKKSYSPAEFSVPFSDWVEIMKKIENRFIKKVNSNYHFSNWKNNIRKEIEVATINAKDLESSLMFLTDSTNHWVIIPNSQAPTASHYVYDCNLGSLIALVRLHKASFFIVEKKYGWFTFFCVTEDNNSVTILKSGESITPFDKLANG
ncbi:DUF6756 family protein [Puia sp.]|jgi:hypothetical protein|uniref:DUF6756 family protein n=1 Tax=Puia sp. TaxID=2045100 RepID=UPI002F3EA70A